MNILYNSNLTKVMGSTMGGDAVGQARDRTAQRAAGRPSIESVAGKTWRGCRVAAEDAYVIFVEAVAC
jgi:hypothetical protein